jgi:hypothetical protein
MIVFGTFGHYHERAYEKRMVGGIPLDRNWIFYGKSIANPTSYGNF